MSSPSWRAGAPVNGSARTPNPELSTPCTGQTVGVWAMSVERFENCDSICVRRAETVALWSAREAAGEDGPPTPPFAESVRPATIARRRVRASNSESWRVIPSSRPWSSAAEDRSRAFSAMARRYSWSRRAVEKYAHAKATEAIRRPATPAAHSERNRVEMVSLRKRARACGTKMIVLYFFNRALLLNRAGSATPVRLRDRFESDSGELSPDRDSILWTPRKAV